MNHFQLTLGCPKRKKEIKKKYKHINHTPSCIHYSDILIEFTQLVRCIFFFCVYSEIFNRWTNARKRMNDAPVFICWFALNRMKFAYFFFLYCQQHELPTNNFSLLNESVGIFIIKIQNQNKIMKTEKKIIHKIYVIMISTRKFHIHWIQRRYMTESRRFKKKRKEKTIKYFTQYI